MSTTVTYKGSTLTTVSNNTKTLKTAGKYMEDDVQLTDVSSTIVISESTDVNGGIIKTITTTDEVNLQVKTINPTTSTQTVNPDTGYDGFSQVIVGAGSGSINNQNKTVTPTKSTQQITADSGYSGLGTVTVEAIPSQYIVPSGNKAITANGTGIDVTQYATVSVNVPTGSTINNQNKTITPTKSLQTVTADSGYTGLGTVTVNAIPSQYIIPSGNLAITANGTSIDVTQYATVSVAVPTGSTVNNQNKSVTPSESQQTVTADSGYTGLGTVTVGAISSTYVGSSITRRDSDDLMVSGATVTTPAGYYSAAASKSVAPGSASAPSSISGTSASVTTGTNTLTLTKTVSVTPTVSAGYISSGTATNSSVSLTASVTTKAAATITPTTTNQTIAAGTYLIGTQTIAGDADLVASNIVSGVQIFGVTGSVVLQNYYTGSSTPASSLGSNGDIYLQT